MPMTHRRRTRAAIFAAVALLGMQGPVDAATAASPPDATAAASFADCKAALETRGGGWCQIAGSKIADVFPTGLPDQMRGWTGPASIIITWTGAAWDGKRRRMYFFGGGHSDYGGNEVYQYDLDTARFTRLTDPSPIPAKTADVPCPEPASGPRAMHSYDNLVFSKVTDTMWLFGNFAGYCFGGEIQYVPQVWEFNPGTKARNGLAPKAWRLVQKYGDVPAIADGSVQPIMTAELPDGRIYVNGGWRYSAWFDPKSLKWTRSIDRAALGDGAVEWSGAVGKLVEVNRQGVYAYRPGQRPGLGTRWDFPYGTANGTAVVPAGDTVYLWNGLGDVLRLHEGRWQLWPSASGPEIITESGRVYSKAAWVPSQDGGVLIGYANPLQGMWVWKPPAAGWLDLPTKTAQSYIDAAPEGTAVEVPPGYYARGLHIDKSLTVDLDGVVFSQIVGGKAYIVVENPKKRIAVTLDHVGVDSRIKGNFASIRADYDFDLTVRNFHLRGTNMGILTGNLGGDLTLVDGTIEDTGGGTELSHGIYKGYRGSLTMRRVTVRRLHHLGHLVKSRADRTVIENCRLLGLDGRYSTEIDLSNGGDLVVENSVLQKGPNTDNPQMFNIGVEAGITVSGGIKIAARPSHVVIKNNWLIFDRKAVQPEPAWQAGLNYFGRWRVPPGPGSSYTVTGNKIVGQVQWKEFADLSAGNTMYADRAAAGLGPAEIPPLPGR